MQDLWLDFCYYNETQKKKTHHICSEQILLSAAVNCCSLDLALKYKRTILAGKCTFSPLFV